MTPSYSRLLADVHMCWGFEWKKMEKNSASQNYFYLRSILWIMKDYFKYVSKFIET